jgi:hypothetical protein
MTRPRTPAPVTDAVRLAARTLCAAGYQTSCRICPLTNNDCLMVARSTLARRILAEWRRGRR